MPEQPRTVVATARAVAIAVVFFGLVAGIYAFFVRTQVGQQLDASSFGAVTVVRSAIGPWGDRLRIILFAASGALVLLLLVIALLRKQWRDVIVAVAICVITSLVSLALKDVVITRPSLGNFGYAYNTFPSDHEAITAAALIASYLLLPSRWRRPVVLVLFVVFGTASGLFQVVSYAHRPSDVMAGALLAGGVAGLFLRRKGTLGKGWRWVFWVFVGLAAVIAAGCFVTWQQSGYATQQAVVGTLAVLLASAATVAASLAVGAELTARSPDSEP